MAGILLPELGCDAEELEAFGIKAAREEAPGIPSRKFYGDLNKLKAGQLIDMIIQRHLAERAGPHFDVRFGGPEGLYSWATRKPLPMPGGRTALFQQPMHSYKHREFEGTIPAGRYGAGRVKKHEEGKLLFTKVSPNFLHFTMAHRKHPERFVLFKPEKWKDKDWLLVNTTPIEAVPYEKIRYKKIPAEQVDEYIDKMEEGDSLEAKIDGASSLIKFLKDRVELVSYRTSKTTGRPIVHTEKFFGGIPQLKIPPELVGTVLKGELYGRRGDKEVIPPHELGGLLTSTIEKSLASQKERGIQLKNMLYDIQQLGKKPIDPSVVPRAERRQMIEQALKYLPADRFHISQQAITKEDARKLWGDIQAGKHPLTREGVVLHPRTGKPMKGKLVEDVDVHITGTFPGQKKWEGRGAGGFTYALKPGGETVGRVGTGFSDEMRRAMYTNPEDYTGRVARLHSQQQHESGAYRAPSFIALHEDYPGGEKKSSALARPISDAYVSDLAEICILKESAGEEDNYQAQLEKLAESLYLRAFRQTPFSMNIPQYLRDVYRRGQRNVQEAYSFDQLRRQLEPTYGWQQAIKAYEGGPGVISDPLDQLIQKIGPLF